MVSLNRAGKTVARNATKLRHASGLSQRDFAKAVGISRNTQRMIEDRYEVKATYTPSISTVMKLAKASGVTVEQFISVSLS